MSVHLSCRNMDCRILTYVGIAERPLDRCPVCQSVGSLASDIPIKPRPSFHEKEGVIEDHTYQGLSSPTLGASLCIYESRQPGIGTCNLPPGHAVHSVTPV